MYEVPKPESFESLLTSLKSDPTNAKLEEYLADIDKGELANAHLLTDEDANLSEDQKTALVTVFKEARIVLNLVRKI
jgi:hypothetical protein